MSPLEKTKQEKESLRTTLRIRRRNQLHKDELSAETCERLAGLSEFQQAQCILFYIDVRDELRTQCFLASVFHTQAKRLIVPYCENGLLKLFELRSLSELTVGAFGILEPSVELRLGSERRVPPDQIDLALIPGLGFDPSGARIGYGKGYYDKLLPLLRRDCLRIGLAFECQITRRIPTSEHDQHMDLIISAVRLIDCKGCRRI